MINDIESRIIQEPETEECIKLLAHSFCDYDPMEEILHITEEEFSLMVRNDWKMILKDRLSLSFRDRLSGDLLSVGIVIDSCFQFEEAVEHIADKFSPVAAIVNELHHPYMEEHQFEPGDVAYIYMGSVNPDCQGRGIATYMFEEIGKFLKQRNYRKVFTITTNLGSYKALKKNGYKDVNEVLYKTFEYQGQRVFEGIEEHPGLTLLEKDLS